jgi:hypothetical protein
MKRQSISYPVSIGPGLYAMTRVRDLYTLDSLRTTYLPPRGCDHERHPDGTATCKCGHRMPYEPEPGPTEVFGD